MVTEESIKQALKAVKYPGFSRDIISFGLLKKAEYREGTAEITLDLSNAKPEAIRQIQEEATAALKALPGVAEVRIETPAAAGQTARGPNPWANQNRVAGVKRIIAVASGKGGVGKSTVSVNLACALARLGKATGLLDCDIYGPSIPLMMGVNQRPVISEEEKMVPLVNYGVKLMSIGFLLDGDTPVIWRGPMIVNAIQQFLGSVAWGELDYLLVDLPPGTGDAQLTLCQTVPLDGGVVVTTPQEASLGVVRKGINMFTKLNVPILGLVENMSYFEAPGGQRVEIFGHGGGREEAARQQIPFLGEIPIFTAIRIGGDQGVPVVCADPPSAPAKCFMQIAERLT